ncbi:aspartate kinase [Cerasicoccus arenae]|uniref:Aspartokinase n=1 Tax=Cerasicoccus arenae TaxID=424488 RepID=A0A8J3GFP5_9BACT|nr:aspartate kinase [Cerasicoccus arenae]MBK1859454.1 aspartate kinase [Cerasicoccus arenae]GHC13653.1 aspartokinase [Cerasicoccus arenae]
MALIVQKYGGTSVKDVDRIQNVARRVKSFVDQGNQVVVVVSARGGVTNELVDRAKEINPHPAEREMDMLLACGEQETIALTAMALHAIGQPAVSRLGYQAGFVTDKEHTRARIIDITGGDIKERLALGEVVIVAGFQGQNTEGEITTLGRGGSDLSAVALAAGLKADLCQIFTDVEGVYTADPRVVPNARKINEISYEEMLELASMGSKVMQARSVEFAQKHGVIFEVRSSFNDQPGTIVKAEVPSMEDVVVSGVALDKNQAKITVSDLPDKPGTAALVFQALGAANVIVDMIVQNVGRGGAANLTFTVAKDDIHRAVGTVEKALENYSGVKVNYTGDIAKLSVVGVGMRSHAGVAATLFDILAKHSVNIQMISTSEIRISVAIDLDNAVKAAQAVHDGFHLDQLA